MLVRMTEDAAMILGGITVLDRYTFASSIVSGGGSPSVGNMVTNVCSMKGSMVLKAHKVYGIIKHQHTVYCCNKTP